MSLTKTGPWVKFQTRLNNPERFLLDPVTEPLLEFGQQVHEKITEYMLEVDPLDNAKLADSTVRKKRRAGNAKPEKAWRATGWLAMNGFDVPRIIDAGNGQTAVTIQPSNRSHPSAGVTARDLIIALEMGTSTQPPRPLMGPLLKRIRHNGFRLLENFGKKYNRKVRVNFEG